MEILQKIPFIDSLIASKKAKMLAVLVSLFLMDDQLGLSIDDLRYLTYGFCAYFIAQGLSDVGEWLSTWISPKADDEKKPVVEPATESTADVDTPPTK
jgi:hypothetical protein